MRTTQRAAIQQARNGPRVSLGAAIGAIMSSWSDRHLDQHAGGVVARSRPAGHAYGPAPGLRPVRQRGAVTS